MIQLPDFDKSVWVWYKNGLITFYTSNYLSYFTEYEHNKELIHRYNMDVRTWKFNQNALPRSLKKKPIESRIDCMLANRGVNVFFSTNAAWTIIEL